MRTSLMATAAAALVLTLSGRAFAEVDITSTVAPPESTSPRDLMFGKPDGLDRTSPTKPPSAEPPGPVDQANPADDAAPAVQAAPAVVASDAVTQRLQDLVENKLRQYVPEERDRAGVLAFYKDRNFAPIWVADGSATPRADQAAAFLHGIAADALDPADYPTPQFGDTEPAKLAVDELMMTNSVVTFARHASIGRVAFSRVSAAVYYEQKAPNAADVLAKLASSTDERATLDSYNPQSSQYKALRAELAATRSGKSFEAKNPTTMPQAEPKTAVKDNATKKGHGTERAKAAERKPKGASVDSIIANMERWRWMPHELGARYVMVNLPDYTLKVVKDGKTVWSTKIVDGQPGEHATPLLTETMKYITVNPTWNVPPSIIRNEYLPALARDRNALTRVGLKMGHNPDGSVRIYQPPGEKNALGRIRFNFPNRFLVYQHDTPNKNLFAKSERAYSHGCMRVQNPEEYAEVLLGVSQPEDHYTAAKIHSMYGSNERNISLKHQIPVYLTYQTVFTDDSGTPQTRADIYGLDRETLNVLHGDRHVADTPIARNYNSSSKPVKSTAPSGRKKEASNSRQHSLESEKSQAYGQSAYQAPDRIGVQ